VSCEGQDFHTRTNTNSSANTLSSSDMRILVASSLLVSALPYPQARAFTVSFRSSTLRRVNLPRSFLRMTSSSSSVMESLLNCPKLELNDGTLHPQIGFGTYKVGFIPASASSAVANPSEDEVERTARECVADALSLGYRFLDCAEFYGNEREVGKAIAESGIPREELYLESKVWTTTIEKGPDAVKAQLEKTLSDLGIDYIDLYCIHWPVPGKHVEAYKALCELHEAGKIKTLGLSNYAVEDYDEMIEAGIKVLPSINQIEINPFLYRQNTINYFQQKGVVMQSYRSLRDGKAFEDPTLMKVAKKYGKSTAQILGRWCVQKGCVYIPKSVKKERMEENALVFDFELSDDEMKELDGLTTSDAIEKFKGLYRKCVNRDTSKDGTLDGVKMEITFD